MKKTKNNVCEYYTKVSQLIKDKTGSGEDYIDSYNFCSQLKILITKKKCHLCKLYSPLNNKT